jgi:hypothetical protein
MLLILATSRGVWVTLEQPASSTMHYLPDFVATAKAIQQHLGIWKEQFLQGSQKAVLVFERIPIQLFFSLSVDRSI